VSSELIAILGIILAAVLSPLLRRPRERQLERDRVIDRKAREARDKARAAERTARAAAENKRRARLAELEEERRRIARASDEELARMLDQ
jgi:hypothetical protein